jgi:hypothetical protein
MRRLAAQVPLVPIGSCQVYVPEAVAVELAASAEYPCPGAGELYHRRGATGILRPALLDAGRPPLDRDIMVKPPAGARTARYRPGAK